MFDQEVALPDTQTEIKSLFSLLREFKKYLFKKKFTILAICLVSGIAGALYNYYQKPSYTANLMFAFDDENGDASGYLGLAEQFGISLGGGGGGAFKGENLFELFKSRYIIEKTLKNTASINEKTDLLINHLIGLEYKKFNNVKFTSGLNSYLQDSVTSVIYKDIIENKLNISRVDKRLTFVSASFKSDDQVFSKVFVESLLDDVIKLYTETKTKKARQNVAVMTKELDSVRSLMTGAIYRTAATTDLNVNPVRQMLRAPIQRSSADAQVYTIAYGEIMKHLEIAKMSLLKETPLVQVIDKPVLPLKKEKKGRLAGFIIWGGVAFLIVIIIYYLLFLLQIRKAQMF